MNPILVLYATGEGQTRRVAEYVAAELRIRGLTVTTHDARALPRDFELSGFGGAVLAGSVHVGRHPSELVAFAKQHRHELDRMHTAFLSVSMSEADVEGATPIPAKREEARRAVEDAIERFRQETGWRPERVLPVAGALLYTQYGVIIRFVMKQIRKRAGGTTDTAHDHVYTDWTALDRFVGELAPALS